MTVNYCDFVAGDDSAGDGSAANPFKTITKASEGLMGGDEVRCAKSPAPSALSGTLTWTNGSASVTTSADLTAVLAAKDFIRKTSLNAGDYDIWWEISGVTSTTITLVQAFRGYSESCASQRLGTTDTGVATSGQNVQLVSSSGDDTATPIEISGGWDLSTETQDGETWFRQTGSTKYGNGLNASGNDFIKLSKCHFLRYNYCLYIYSETGWTIEYCQLLGAGSVALYSGSTLSDVVFSHITSNGVLRLGYGISHGLVADNIVCINGQVRCYGRTTSLVARNTDLWADVGSITSGVSGDMINLNAYAPCRLYNVSGIVSVAVQNEVMGPHYVTIKNVDGATDEQAHQAFGYAQKDTAEARSGACICIYPYDEFIPFEQVFKLVASASSSKTVSVYMKRSVDFDGVVEAALMFKGRFLADFVIWEMTEAYQQFSLTAQAADIDEAGVLELWIRVRGTTGSVYIDDLS